MSQNMKKKKYGVGTSPVQNKSPVTFALRFEQAINHICLGLLKILQALFTSFPFRDPKNTHFQRHDPKFCYHSPILRIFRMVGTFIVIQNVHSFDRKELDNCPTFGAPVTPERSSQRQEHHMNLVHDKCTSLRYLPCVSEGILTSLTLLFDRYQWYRSQKLRRSLTSYHSDTEIVETRKRIRNQAKISRLV